MLRGGEERNRIVAEFATGPKCRSSAGCVGGGKHKDKQNKVDKKQGAIPQRSEPLQGQLEQKDAGESESEKKLATQECDMDAMIRMMQENKDCRIMFACVSEGHDMEVEQKIQATCCRSRRCWDLMSNTWRKLISESYVRLK